MEKELWFRSVGEPEAPEAHVHHTERSQGRLQRLLRSKQITGTSDLADHIVGWYLGPIWDWV